MKPRFASFIFAIVAACGGGGGGDTPTQIVPPPSTPVATSLQLNDGDGQAALPGLAVTRNPSIIVKDAAGSPFAGASVQFVVVSGGGSIVGATAVSNSSGIATAGAWTLGATGTQQVEARLSTLTPVRFSATLTPTVTEATIGTGGGTIEITSVGHPYQGFKLTVPAGTFATTGNWSVALNSSAPAPVLPSGFVVVGPALSIQTEQLRGEHLMTLRIPVTRTTGTAQIVVARDPQSGRVEMMPIIGMDASSITVGGSHLNGSLIAGASATSAVRANIANPIAKLHAASSAMSLGIDMYRVSVDLSALGISPADIDAALVSILWPGPELGSYLFPNGHGPAIPLMEMLARIQNQPIATAVKTINGLGTLADTAALGALQIMAKRHFTGQSGASSLLTDLAMAWGSLTPPVRDSLTSLNMRGMLLTSKLPQLMLFTERLTDLPTGKVGRSMFATLFRLTTPTLWYSAPYDPFVSGQLTLGSSGFVSRNAKLTADAPSFTADAVLPLGGSFLYPIEQYADIPPFMMGTLNSSGAARNTANNLIATAAGFPTVTLETESTNGAGWVPLDNPAVVRDTNAKIRTVCANCTDALSQYTDAKQQTIATSTGPCVGGYITFSGAGCGGSRLLDQLGFGDFVGTALPFMDTRVLMGQLANAYRIAVPLHQPLVQRIFRVVPDSQGVAINTATQFSAPVLDPPVSGYGMDWNWGDGSAHTLTQNSSTATHSYAARGNYTITVSLKRSNTAILPNLVIATAKAAISVGFPTWKFTTATIAFDTLTPTPFVGGFSSAASPQWRYYAQMFAALNAKLTQGGLMYLDTPQLISSTTQPRGLYLLDAQQLNSINANNSLQVPGMSNTAAPTGSLVRATVLVSYTAPKNADQPAWNEMSTETGSIAGTGGTWKSNAWDVWSTYTGPTNGLPTYWPLVNKSADVTFTGNQATGTMSFFVRNIATGKGLPAAETTRWTVTVTFSATRIQ